MAVCHTCSNSIIVLWKTEKSKRIIVCKNGNVDDIILVRNYSTVILRTVKSQPQLIRHIQLHMNT